MVSKIPWNNRIGTAFLVINILDFEKTFPLCRVFTLEKNYRSTQEILNAATAVVINLIHPCWKISSTDRTSNIVIPIIFDKSFILFRKLMLILLDRNVTRIIA